MDSDTSKFHQQKADSEITVLKAEIASLKQTVAELQGKGDFRRQLASRVTAIVGLQEALSSERPRFRRIWSFLLLLGFTATILQVGLTTQEYLEYPVATMVELRADSKYEYDPLILCPDSWLDAEKAISNGLSIEGLKYSLGYFNDFDNIHVKNGSKAREEFLKFYFDHNFTSLRNYLDFITVDLIRRDTPTDVSPLNSSIPSYICNACDDSQPKKMFLGGGMCYVVKLSPADAGTGSASAALIMNLYNRTQGIVQITKYWSIGFCRSNHTSFTMGCPRTKVKSAFHSHVKLTVHQYATLSARKSYCSDISDRAYSQAQCMGTCRSDTFAEAIHCHQFWNYGGFLPPTDVCNFFDETLPNRNISFSEFYRSKEFEELNTRSNVECARKCPRPCVRYVNEISLRSEFDMRDYGKVNSMIDASRPNAFVIFLDIEHSASYDGGILTWTEVKAYSFAQLVSNFGGAFGLFVGGTIMTVAQFVMFIIDYAIDKKEKRREEAGKK